MTETTSAAPASEPPKAKSPKKKVTASKGGASAGKPKAKPSHPPTAQMVTSAIRTLKERGGSSLQAIKKYISSTYKVDAEKMAPFIRKYLKNAVAAGSLVRTKGNGASGSFKLPGGAATEEAKKKAAGRPKVAKKAATSGTAKKEKKTKAPSKAKKAKKPPTTPKAPKPKKTTAKSPKKPAAKKVAKKPAASKKASPKKK